ncbi:hypothetical protein HK101_011016 [Irineochytrium annulatum]|nr:hypothetical protein HK101_011016 [Irineochytrium annulatum]
MGDVSPASTAIAWLVLAIYTIAFPLNVRYFLAILLAAYVKHRRTLLQRTIDHLFLFIVLIELIWCILFAWMVAHIVIIRHGFDSSPEGDLLCQIAGVVVLETAGNAITTHMLIAIERWLTVVAGVRDSRVGIAALLLVLEAGFAGMAYAQWRVMSRRFEPAESGLYSFFPLLVGPSGDYAPLAVSIVAVGYCSLSTAVILGAYGYIYVTAIRVRRAVGSTGHGSSDEKRKRSRQERTTHTSHTTASDESHPSSTDGRMSVDNAVHPTRVAGTTSDENGVKAATLRAATSRASEDRKLFFRCVAVLGVFLSTYSLAFYGFLYKLIANRYVSVTFDTVAMVLTSCDMVVTPIMIVVTNRKVAAAAADVVGMKMPSGMRGHGKGRVQPADDVGEPVDAV